MLEGIGSRLGARRHWAQGRDSRISVLAWLWVPLAVGLLAKSLVAQGGGELPLSQIKLPPGFRIEVYAAVTKPRQMVLSPSGTVFVGSMNLASKEPRDVYALVDRDHDNVVDKVVVVAKGLTHPNGVAMHDGALYISAMDRVVRVDDVEANLDAPPAPVVVASFPGEFLHGWKFIGFSPDGHLFVPVGAPCNVCDRRQDDPRFGTIMRLNADGSDPQVYVRGVRNSVGFDFHPVTNELWFTNNGLDTLGDDVPPDTLHRVAKPGTDFGFPYCHAGDIPDPEFGDARPCSEFAKPTQKLGAHVAALGMAFYTGEMFPPEYRQQIFIAEHGSIFRKEQKVGYRVTVVKLDGQGTPISYEPFAEGWLQGQKNWGRPVDVLVMPDGALLISDDQADAIYRVSYAPR